MLPGFSRNDMVDVPGVDTKHPAEWLLFEPARKKHPDLANLFIGQFHVWRVFPWPPIAMPENVGNVAPLCIPTKVGDRVVAGISIVVATNHPLGARTDERL